MIKKIITVGTTTQNNKFVNGQSVMFQLLYDSLVVQGINVKLVDFGVSTFKGYNDKRVSGKFSFIKLIDNIKIAIIYLSVLIFNPKTSVYITTSQSKVGFLRDYLFINLAKLFRRKVIAHQLGGNYEKFYSSVSKKTQNRIKTTIEKADFFIVEGEYTKAQLSFVENYQRKVVVIPNALANDMENATGGSKILTEPIRLLYLSNLIEGKGYWDVLETANILKNNYSLNIQVTFAGKFLSDLGDVICRTAEDSYNLFLNKIEEFNLQNVVTYYPGVYGEEKAALLQKSHFFLLPSYYINEGQPVSAIEAIAYGCVPIVTDYRILPTIVNESNGFFVSPKSPDEIVKCILFSVNNKEVYNKKSAFAIEHFQKNFTASKHVEAILKLI